MEFIEKFDLTNVNYINDLKLDDFRNFLLKTDFYSKTLSNEKEIKGCFFSVKNILKKILKDDGTLTVKYSFSNGCNKGRLFGEGAQRFPLKIRGFLCNNTTDIDMVNAHPTILLYICKKYNIPCVKLEHLVNNREDVYNLHTMDRTDTKLFYLSTLYEQHYAKTTDVSFYNEFRNEIQTIHKQLQKIPSISNIYFNKTQKNPYGTMLSKLIEEYENNILQTIIDTLKQKNITISTLMFDGLMVNGNHYDNPNLLSDIEEMIETNFPTINMKLSFKPHDTTIKLPDGYTVQSPHIRIKNWLSDLTTNIGTVHELERRVPSKFVWIKKIHYAWTNSKWITDSRSEFDKYVSTTLFNQIKSETFEAFKTFKDELTTDKNGNPITLSVPVQCGLCCVTLNIVKLKLENGSFLDAVFKKAESFFTNEEIEFDVKPHLIGFNNGCFDTEKWEFRPLKYDDYITMSCGYDYDNSIDIDKLKTVETILKQIHPDDEIRSLYLQTLSKGFHGIPLEHFIVYNGGGGNGKGLIDEYMEDILGDYVYGGFPVDLFTQPQTSGANPFKAKMDKKRLLISKEPSGNTKLRVDNIREITGGGTMSARDVYANKKNSTIKNTWITIMECNKKPLLNEEPDQAEVRRFIDIHFGSTFVNNPDNVDEANRIYLANKKLKTTEWKTEHRNEMVYILLNNLKLLRDNDFNFKIPLSVQKRTDEYLQESFPILEIFMNLYEKTDNEDDVVKLRDVVNNLKSSDIYNNFTKSEKRKFTVEKITNFIKINVYFKKHYKDRIQKQGFDCQGLVGIKLKQSDNDDEQLCECD